MPESPSPASFACTAVRHQVVGRAYQLEVIQVVEHGDALGFQLPQNGWGQVMIDVAHVGDIRTKFRDQATQLLSRLGRINGVPCKSGASQQSVTVFLEID